MLVNIILTIFIFFLPSQEIIKGKVVEVIDGNTLEIITEENESYKIELAGLDCPELLQRFGPEAKRFLEKRIKEKKVEAFIEGKNRWGIRQAIVIPNGGDDPRINLLAEGLAWTSEKNADPEFELIKDDAKVKRKGLWIEAEPTPPWVFRRQQTMTEPKWR